MANELFDSIVAGRRLRVVASDRRDGDIHPRRTELDVLAERQRSIAGSLWAMVDQVHGVEALSDGREEARWPSIGCADVIVSEAVVGRPVGVWAADCATLVLFGANGSVVGAHAGWRGLADGVVDVAVERAVEGGQAIDAVVVGPLIHACCYEFGRDDLDGVAHGVHAAPSAISGVTSSGNTALDVPAAVSAALAHHGLIADVVGPCTGCDDHWYSHRVRNDAGRHATVAWVESVV